MIIRLVSLLVLSLGLIGCATTNDPMADDSRPRESTIPWNRPASWEGPGVYGSALNPR